MAGLNSRRATRPWVCKNFGWCGPVGAPGFTEPTLPVQIPAGGPRASPTQFWESFLRTVGEGLKVNCPAGAREATLGCASPGGRFRTGPYGVHWTGLCIFVGAAHWAARSCGPGCLWGAASWTRRALRRRPACTGRRRSCILRPPVRRSGPGFFPAAHPLSASFMQKRQRHNFFPHPGESPRPQGLSTLSTEFSTLCYVKCNQAAFCIIC